MGFDDYVSKFPLELGVVLNPLSYFRFFHSCCEADGPVRYGPGRRDGIVRYPPAPPLLIWGRHTRQRRAFRLADAEVVVCGRTDSESTGEQVKLKKILLNGNNICMVWASFYEWYAV